MMIGSPMAVRSRLAVLISDRNTRRLEAREKRLTLRQIATESGVPLSVLYGLTTDREGKQAKQVAFETLNKLCRYFGCTPNDLLLYTPDPTE